MAPSPTLGFLKSKEKEQWVLPSRSLSGSWMVLQTAAHIDPTSLPVSVVLSPKIQMKLMGLQCGHPESVEIC